MRLPIISSIPDNFPFIKKTVKLFIPLLGSEIAYRFAIFGSALFMAMVDDEHLAANALIGTLENLVLGTGVFMLVPASIIVSRVIENTPEKVGEILYASYLVSTVLSGLSMLILSNPETFLKLIGQPMRVSNLTGTYFRHLLFGMPAGLLSISSELVSYKTCGAWPSFVIRLIRHGVYLFFGYGLLLGRLGMPKLGVGGLGLSHAGSLWLSLSLYLLYFKLNPSLKEYNLLSMTSFNRGVFSYVWEICRDGIMTGGSAINDFIVNFVNVILLGYKGHKTLAAGEVALQLRGLSILPTSAISEATPVILRAIPDVKQRKSAGSTNTWLSLLFPAALIPLGLGFSDQLIHLFVNKHDHGDHTVSLAKDLLIYSLISVLFYNVQKMLSAGYRGFERYLLPAATNVFSTLLLGIGLACLFDFVFDMSAGGIFLAMMLAQVIFSFLLTLFWSRDVCLQTSTTDASGILGSGNNDSNGAINTSDGVISTRPSLWGSFSSLFGWRSCLHCPRLGGAADEEVGLLADSPDM